MKSSDVSPALPGEPDHWYLRKTKRNHVARAKAGGMKGMAVKGKEGTIFKKLVVDPEEQKNVLKDGKYSTKIGPVVTVGSWAGAVMRTLTLEERATCPSSCKVWDVCYGNRMNFARRMKTGQGLMVRLSEEIHNQAEKGLVVVRLHILGDFYSEEYVAFWLGLLNSEPNLRIFGFTAHEPNSPMGEMVRLMNDKYPEKCRIRFSNPAEGLGTIDLGQQSVVVRQGELDHAAAENESETVLCPAQTGKTANCGTCGLCWSSEKRIAFMEH